MSINIHLNLDEEIQVEMAINEILDDIEQQRDNYLITGNNNCYEIKEMDRRIEILESVLEKINQAEDIPEDKTASKNIDLFANL